MRKRSAESAVDITLPITPMLDMSFQLLSFFILTFSPMAQEGQMAINLPKIDSSDAPAPTDPTLPEDKKDEYTLTLFAEGGDIGVIGFRSAASTESFGGVNKLKTLFDKLNSIVRQGKEKDSVSITIEAAPDLSYARLIEVMDICKRAGYESVNLTPIPKAKP